jgi:hypothetical protein
LGNASLQVGLAWKTYEGIAKSDGTLISPDGHGPHTEQTLYSAAGLAWIEPAHRELPWLKKHLDGGLGS